MRSTLSQSPQSCRSTLYSSPSSSSVVSFSLNLSTHWCCGTHFIYQEFGCVKLHFQNSVWMFCKADTDVRDIWHDILWMTGQWAGVTTGHKKLHTTVRLWQDLTWTETDGMCSRSAGSGTSTSLHFRSTAWAWAPITSEITNSNHENNAPLHLRDVLWGSWLFQRYLIYMFLVLFSQKKWSQY